MVVKHLTLVPKQFSEIKVNQMFMDNKEQILTKITDSTAARIDHGALSVVKPFPDADFHVIDKINLTNSEHAAYLDGVYETLEVVRGRYPDTFEAADKFAIYNMIADAYSADGVKRRFNIGRLAAGLRVGDVIEIIADEGYAVPDFKKLLVTCLEPNKLVSGIVVESYPKGAKVGCASSVDLSACFHMHPVVVDHKDSLDISDLIGDNEEEE